MRLLRGWINRTRKILKIRLRPYAAGVQPAIHALRRKLFARAEPERYSTDWYGLIYADLGSGFLNSGLDSGANSAPGGGREGAGGCLRCPAGLVLGLLPREEAMFRARINDTDFQLGDNPVVPGRKVITCGKMGRCGGHMPYVCRTSPAQFARGLFYVDETRCETSMTAFLAENGAEVERLRRIAQGYQLHLETLGYARVVPGRRLEPGPSGTSRVPALPGRSDTGPG